MSRMRLVPCVVYQWFLVSLVCLLWNIAMSSSPFEFGFLSLRADIVSNRSRSDIIMS